MPARPRATVAAMLACVASLAGCHSVDSDPTDTCTHVGGAWEVSLDYGNGLVGRQTWLIEQTGCDLILTADPPDDYGPALAGPVSGYAVVGGFSAYWENTANACRYSSRLDATITGDVFSGSIAWGRNGYGAGYCPAAIGSIAVEGSR